MTNKCGLLIFALVSTAFIICSLNDSVQANTIKGNHPGDVATLTAAVRANRSMQLDLTIVLSVHDQAGLEQLLSGQQDPSSNNYHRWLTPAQFAQRFGPTQAQTEAVAQWLRSAGFQIKSINRLGRTIEAAGSVAQAESAFQTSIVMSGASFGNTSDPVIPAQFDGLIAAIQGLDNMQGVVPAGLDRSLEPASTPALTGTILALADLSDPGAMSTPDVAYGGSTAFGPLDVEKFYDESPLINGGNSGTASPDCIALDEDSDYLDAAVPLFATSFNVAPFNISRVGTSPGTNGDETEALLDIDYAHATAPGTPIHVYMNSSLYTSIQNSITDNVCGAISISFIYCSSTNSFFTGLDSLFAQAAAQGQSVFLSSGDWGAAGLQYDSSTNGCAIGTTLNASEMAASPHVTGVGGTTFNPQFDGSGNDTSVVGIAPGGIESGWSSSGGGVSKIFSRPAWQSGPGVPSGSMRDVPDVAMIAWTPAVFIGADVGGVAQIQCCWGGTSLSSPLWAGYSRVIASQAGTTRLGLLNPTIYKLANAGLSTNGFEDVISGNNTYNGVSGYSAGAGYDLVTGWGSVDMTNFASAFNGASQPSPTATATPKPTASPSATATAKPTSTATATHTPAPTASPIATVKPTSTATATHTPAPTASPTATAKPTSTATATHTPAPTASPTATAKPTSTATATHTPAPTASPTATAKPTSTATATHTPAPTASPTATAKPTSTATATHTPAPTASPTATAKPTSTATATHTPAPTASPTATAKPTSTATATHTPAPTASPIATVKPTSTATATHTPAPTASPIATVKPTSTATATHTPAPTASPTATAKPTSTATATHTPAPTASPTATAKPTSTATATRTASPTRTPAPTQTPTPTATPAVLTVSPLSMSFAKTKVGHASGTSTVTLANPKGSSTSATITSAGLMVGTNFQIVSSTCTAGKVLAPGSSCAVGVKFTPHSTGGMTDMVRFVDSAPGSPQNASLSGTGQ